MELLWAIVSNPLFQVVLALVFAGLAMSGKFSQQGANVFFALAWATTCFLAFRLNIGWKPSVALVLFTGSACLILSYWIEPKKPPAEPTKPTAQDTPHPAHAQPYLWLDFNPRFPDENGRVTSSSITLRVADYPTSAERLNLVSLSSLENIHVTVYEPFETRLDVNGWHSCVVAEKRSAQWNNQNSTYEPIGKVHFRTNLTILEAELSANGGNWRGLAIVRKDKKGINVEEWITGQFKTSTSDRSPMSIYRRWSDLDCEVTDGVTMLALSAELLRSYGISRTNLSSEELKAICSNMVYTQRLPDGKTVILRPRKE